LLALPVFAFGAGCPLADSIYEDADGNGFQLEFRPASGKAANVTHTAIIKHPKRGVLFEFNVSTASGFAETLLSPKNGKGGEEAHRIHFFGKNLESADWDESAPEYAFIEGLGYADYYGNQDKGGREVTLGNPMWKFTLCRKTSQEKAERPLQPSPEPKKLSSAEWIDDGGRIAAYGIIKSLGIKEGKPYLGIDYVEWLSEEECRRRIKAGTLKWDEDECEVEVRILNENPLIRSFSVSRDVEIICQYPDQPPKSLSWHNLTEIWRARTRDTEELREGLWKIERRDGVIERMEWVWLP
jgi:hypothetical protein